MAPFLADLVHPPARWTDWDKLPGTSRETYLRIIRSHYELTSESSLTLPFSPHKPGIVGPAMLPHGRHERTAISNRLRASLSSMGCRPGASIVIVSDVIRRYLASDIADLLQTADYYVRIILVGMDPQASWQMVGNLSFDWLIALSDDLPDGPISRVSRGGLITLNRPNLVRNLATHCDFIHCEDIPFIAVRVNNGKYVPCEGLFVEWTRLGPQVTPLTDSSLPVVRYMPDLLSVGPDLQRIS